MDTIRFLTESGEPFITEAGDYLVTDEIQAGLSSSAAVTAELEVIFALTASLSASASLEADLTTLAGIGANLSATASLSASITTGINGAATLQAQASLTGLLGSIVEMDAALAAQAAASASLTTQINAAASLSASPVLLATLDTQINALASLVSVSNLLNASLTVNRIRPRFTARATDIYLAELQAYDPTTDSVITWRYSSGQGYDNDGVYYAPRIENPASLTRRMGGASVGGRTSLSFGELTLVNNDQTLNALGDTFVDGRTLTIKRGDRTDPYENFATILVATMESVAMERERISVRLRDKAVTLETPFSAVKYAGDNILPYGIEGTMDDIGGQPKPRIFGRIALMQPVLVNTSKLIYQVNAGAIDSLVNVFDAGAYLSRSTDYASQSEMETTAPAQGSYRAWPAGGCFRLGSSPYGQLGACVAESWDYLDNSAAGIIQRILTEKGYTSSDWVAADFTTLNQRNVAPLGVIVEGDETTASLLDRLCQSVGAWWGFDALGRFRVARLDAPTGVPALTLTDREILEMEREPESEMPIWQTTLKADVNYVVQDKTSLAGVVSDPRAAWFAQATRDQITEDATVKTQRLLAEQQSYDSILNGISVAKAESSRRLALFSERRDTVNVTLAHPHSYDLELGSVVELDTTRLGYDSGKLFIVVGIGLDYAANQLDLTLWG